MLAQLSRPGSMLLQAGLIGLILAGLAWTRASSYLLFHSLAELITIMIAVGMFMLVWHSQCLISNTCLCV